MNTRLVWLLSGIALVYVVGLLLAVVYGSDTVKVAVIAVGGTAVGALAGLFGSLAGARTQASAAQAAANLQAETSLNLKKTELAESRSQLLLQERSRWAVKCYDELNTLLSTSRDVGASAASYSSTDEISVEMQKIATYADMLRVNPLIASDGPLCERIDRYVHAISEGCLYDWGVAHGRARHPRSSDWVPQHVLGQRIAVQVGDHIRTATSEII